jgi:F-type H+-transporting ATPase subunit delta
MARKTNPRRYARAAFEIAQENHELDKWLGDLQQLAAIAGNASFLAAMESLKISTADKAQLLKETLRSVGPLAVNLALLLVEKSSFGLIGEIAAEYKVMLNKERGIEEAEVITAVPLDDYDREKMETSLGSITGSKIELKTVVDPGILGGVIARVGGRLLDGSTRSKLAALKRNLEGRG